jgi:hypothetical protein
MERLAAEHLISDLYLNALLVQQVAVLPEVKLFDFPELIFQRRTTII